MRDQPHATLLADQRVSRLRHRGEYAGAFLGQWSSFDAIEMQHARVSGETRKYGGGGVELRPVNHLSQFLPIELIAQAVDLRLRAGNDEPVEISVHSRACRLVTRI